MAKSFFSVFMDTAIGASKDRKRTSETAKPKPKPARSSRLCPHCSMANLVNGRCSACGYRGRV